MKKFLFLVITAFLILCSCGQDEDKSNESEKNEKPLNKKQIENNLNNNSKENKRQYKESNPEVNRLTSIQAENIVYEKFVSGGHSTDEVKTLYNKSTNERYFIEFMSAHADGYPVRLAVWVNKTDGSTSQPIDISTKDEKRKFEEHKADSKIYNPSNEGMYNEDNTSHSDSFQKDKSKNRITSQEEKFNSTSNGNSSKNEK
ncbi:hypothetical protein PZL18_03965 [Staphylococcus epidermidis]|nr:hypothetical protein [Staphylococcus epidermidis]MDH9712649.1 hypothetical protein [Staphylococcus epidermidis]MDH9919621.1 hypothetical protein [Staphylococcus epidermidis]MDH9932504.1 hypothetical protein [Staphylococcus epidermidis]MDH9937138.1 hypothetical protein [Staphylococcus epidermidis]